MKIIKKNILAIGLTFTLILSMVILTNPKMYISSKTKFIETLKKLNYENKIIFTGNILIQEKDTLKSLTELSLEGEKNNKDIDIYIKTPTVLGQQVELIHYSETEDNIKINLGLLNLDDVTIKKQIEERKQIDSEDIINLLYPKIQIEKRVPLSINTGTLKEIVINTDKYLLELDNEFLNKNLNLNNQYLLNINKAIICIYVDNLAQIQKGIIKLTTDNKIVQIDINLKY